MVMSDRSVPWCVVDMAAETGLVEETGGQGGQDSACTQLSHSTHGTCRQGRGLVTLTPPPPEVLGENRHNTPTPTPTEPVPCSCSFPSHTLHRHHQRRHCRRHHHRVQKPMSRSMSRPGSVSWQCAAASVTDNGSGGHHRQGGSLCQRARVARAGLLVVALLCCVGVTSARPSPSSSSYGTPSSNTDVPADAVKYLAKFGYLAGPSREAWNLMSAEGLMEDDLTRAIRSLQAMGRIPQTGKIDQATLALMSQPRCGVEDSRMGVIPGQGRSGRRQGHADRRRVPGRRRYRRYVEAPTKWPKKTLTYRVQNWARGWEEVEVRRTMMDAFKLWSSATRLQFREVASGEADIMIQFASRYHRDGYPFDGKGMILAHAFFPGEGKGGDTHFDDDEKWTLNSTDGVDLFMVAAHEFGHALGLAHSADPGALMYPWYQGFSGKFVLPRDDTEGIQKLYGGPHDDIEFPVQPPVTDVPYVGGDDEDTPDPCTTPFDAITIIRDVVFLFIGKTFWRLDENNKAGAPVNIHKFWRGLPPEVTKVDAVFENPIDKRIIFFSGKRYWLFNANTLLTGFKTGGEPLTDFGIPEDVTRIDTVFTWGFNKRTYLVSRDMYWKLNENNTYRELDYPRDMSIWRGVPESLDAALKYRDGKTYFFKGNRFWKFYDLKMRVEKSYPRRIASDWLQCSSESDSPVVIGSNLAQHSVDSSAAASHRHHGLSVGLSLLLAVLSASRSLLHTQ